MTERMPILLLTNIIQLSWHRDGTQHHVLQTTEGENNASPSIGLYCVMLLPCLFSLLAKSMEMPQSCFACCDDTKLGFYKNTELQNGALLGTK